ncbi:MAG: membrane dipeptidase, partial [Pyrinomonadaceae bacterium]
MHFRKLFCALLTILFGLNPTLPAVALGSDRAGQTPATAPAAAARDEKLWKKALQIQRQAIVVDTHNDILSMMADDNYDLGVSSVGKYHTDIERMKQGGLTAEFFSVYIDRSYARDGGSARRALDMIDYVYRAAER